ncbi:MAG: ArsR/SmtB family transcription factor [Candidatus Hodarchaeales archaeon]|jgi:DNA-binding HxlR family transcriptional regulator
MMESQKPLDESQKSLLQSLDEVTAVLKAISHPNRFKILVLLLTGPQSFQILLDETKLKKTALANHLASLKDKLLVEKIHHGTYKITHDGKKYVQAIESVYEKSREYKNKIKEAKQKYQLSKTFLERNKEKQLIESRQRYQLTKSFLERHEKAKERDAKP